MGAVVCECDSFLFVCIVIQFVVCFVVFHLVLELIYSVVRKLLLLTILLIMFHSLFRFFSFNGNVIILLM
jgi:hypothetical protein